MDRLDEITRELLALFAELKKIQARAVPLVEELETLGLPLPTEIKSMLVSMKATPSNRVN